MPGYKLIKDDRVRLREPSIWPTSGSLSDFGVIFIKLQPAHSGFYCFLDTQLVFALEDAFPDGERLPSEFSVFDKVGRISLASLLNLLLPKLLSGAGPFK